MKTSKGSQAARSFAAALIVAGVLTPPTAQAMAQALPVVSYIQVSAGVSHTCALAAPGTARCWGENVSGELGNGTKKDSKSPTPVSGLSGATQVVAGNGFTCAIVGGGAVKCWGWDAYGQLGDGNGGDATRPVPVIGLSGATQVAAGWMHTCAVLSSGAVKCWGDGREGALGTGSDYIENHPVKITGVAGATQITAGDDFSCASVVGGAVRCWGLNDGGQLGASTPSWHSPTPVTVSGVSGATQIASGAVHTCAIVAGGAIKCWGYNSSGELGDGTTDPGLTPVDVTGITGATQITTGNGYTCALVGGSAKCWGANYSGSLGNGTADSIPHPTPGDVIGVPGATQMSAGFGHACALMPGGVVTCWGANSSGQLGDGTSTDSSTPVDLAGDTSLSMGVPAKVRKGAMATISGSLSSNVPACVDSRELFLRWGKAVIGPILTDGSGDYVFKSKVTEQTVVQISFAGGSGCGSSRSARKTINLA